MFGPREGNIHDVSDDGVYIYACGQHGTSHLRVGGGTELILITTSFYHPPTHPPWDTERTISRRRGKEVVPTRYHTLRPTRVVSEFAGCLDLGREISMMCRMMVCIFMPAANMVQVIWELEGGPNWLAPGGLSGVAEDVISVKIRVGRSHTHY